MFRVGKLEHLGKGAHCQNGCLSLLMLTQFARCLEHYNIKENNRSNWERIGYMILREIAIMNLIRMFVFFSAPRTVLKEGNYTMWM